MMLALINKKTNKELVASIGKIELGFISSTLMYLLTMVAAPSRHVFDEDFYVQFMYISFCFKCVLGSVLRLFKSGFLLSNSPPNHWPCDKNKHKIS